MTLATRLLMARGAGPFDLSIPAVPNEGVFQITAAPDGGHLWIHRAAVHYNGYAYIGYTDTSGNVCIRVVNLATQAVSSEVIVKAALDFDDHTHPGLLVRASDKKLLTFCARHEPLSSEMHMRVSTTSLDTDPTLANGFAAESGLDSQLGARSYDYPSPMQMSNGDIHLYYRNIPTGNEYRWSRSISTDGGSTWSSGTSVYSGEFYYLKPFQTGDRIDFVVQDSSPNIANTSIGHLYWESNAFHKSDGTTVTVPLDFSDASLVHLGSGDGNAFLWDVATGADGHPRVAFATFPTPESDHRGYWARWTGSAWETHEVTALGGPLTDSIPVYAGGISLDPDDTNVVWVSIGSGSVREVSTFTTADDGDTWTEEEITAGSSTKHFRPHRVEGCDLAFWMSGNYTTYSSYNVGITGFLP